MHTYTVANPAVHPLHSMEPIWALGTRMKVGFAVCKTGISRMRFLKFPVARLCTVLTWRNVLIGHEGCR